MKYRTLGASDLKVSEISLGSWLTYGVGVEADKARACLDRAFDLGINFIDTANAYGRGAAETVLGESLAKRPRDSYILATKLFVPMSDTDRGLSRAQVFKQIDASLQRLRTDYVDLYQCHRYDPDTPLEETMQALSEIVRAGKVRWMEKPVLERVQQLKPIAAEAGLTLGQFSLAWVLREPNVASAIVGASRPEQLDENAAASGAVVDPALFKKAEELVAGLQG